MSQSAIVDMTTLEDLQAALEKTGNQCVTIYRSGASHMIGPRWSAPSFRSLPELSQFVASVNGLRASPPAAMTETLAASGTATAAPVEPARVNPQSVANPS